MKDSFYVTELTRQPRRDELLVDLPWRKEIGRLVTRQTSSCSLYPVYPPRCKTEWDKQVWLYSRVEVFMKELNPTLARFEILKKTPHSAPNSGLKEVYVSPSPITIN